MNHAWSHGTPPLASTAAYESIILSTTASNLLVQQASMEWNHNARNRTIVLLNHRSKTRA